MLKKILGTTGIEVSYLGLGSLVMGGLQCGFTAEQARPVLECAIDNGINFIDTAQIYESYHIVAEAVKIKKDIVISSKSYSYDANSADTAVEDALRAVGRDYIDIWMMHEIESFNTIRGHFEAFEQYIRLKDAGKIRAIGISTHYIDGVKGALKFKEIEVVHPLINATGMGILDGTRQEMEQAVKAAHDCGKGIIAMKAFGGGHLLNYRNTAVNYIRSINYIDSVMVGMRSTEEVAFNTAAFCGNKPETEPEIKSKKVGVMDWCIGCGACAEGCPNNAISIERGTAVINRDKCILCGYCGAKCRESAIKIF